MKGSCRDDPEGRQLELPPSMAGRGVTYTDWCTLRAKTPLTRSHVDETIVGKMYLEKTTF